MIEQVHVLRRDIGTVEISRDALPPLAEGAVRLAIESFAITANNVTYAAMGEGFGYWNFFPAPADWGIVPVWGHARVSESRCSDIAVGERVYGYLPMASSLDVIPGNINSRGFTDQAAHRQPMSPIYNQYSRLNADPEHDPAREAERMIFGPLFKTGFLIEAFMRSRNWFGANTAVITSASSKTAIGLASVVQHRSPHIRRIGLTSRANLAFVERTGLYDAVLTYDQVADLPQTEAVSVDFAGNGALLAQIHQTLGTHLQYSCLVGATHIDSRGQSEAADIAGPAPELFFAPHHAVALVKDIGAAAFAEQIGESWHVFLRHLGDTVSTAQVDGLTAAGAAFAGMARGAVDPAKGVVARP